MTCIKTFCVMVLATTLLIFFYLNVQLETAKAIRAVNASKQEDFVRTPPAFQIVRLSSDLKIIPQDGAYWNRLLYAAMKSLDNSENPVRTEPHWSVCREESRELLRINVHDFDSYNLLLQEFLRGMNCRIPPVLIDQPNKCSSRKGDNQTLLFAIKSSPRNFERRQAVREAWGQEGLYPGRMRVHLVFLLGSASSDDPDLSALLSFESKHFKDILQWDFSDTLLNLTLKMNSFLHWTVKNCSPLSFIFSGDDDVFVNTPGLIDYLQSLDASEASELYVGHIISTAAPIRNPKNKYYIPQSFYNGPYPSYAGGGGFLFSGNLLPSLYSLSRMLPIFPIDDVYMGILMKALGVFPKSHAGFQTFDVKEQDRENVCVHKGNLLIHQRFPQQILKMWKGIHSPLLTC